MYAFCIYVICIILHVHVSTFPNYYIHESNCSPKEPLPLNILALCFQYLGWIICVVNAQSMHNHNVLFAHNS